ncbi:hypothetical protein K5D33_07330 [Pseudomonas cichorii]|nr:hypothetical protein [Pseudomonas cichorii]MBX8534535.1 hypothetical protein [Pseudomonas cichorii]
MSFSLDLEEFAEKFKLDLETVVQKAAIDILGQVVSRSPVGNPELWAANAAAVDYNNAVKQHNADLRNDPSNLTKSGRMKPGRLLKDGMDLSAGKDYVGGRFRGNWQVAIGDAPGGVVERIDPGGGETLSSGTSTILDYKIGSGSIWLVNNLPYAVPLEFGHSHIQAPYGMVRLTASLAQSFFDNAVRSIKT